MSKAKKYKILVTEDDNVLREALTKKLGDSGFEIVESRDGRSGLDLAVSEKPDLILLDLMMPHMDGITMLEELRKTDKSTPVIILTNMDDQSKISQAYNLGCSGYLIKSNYTLNDLVEKINNVLGNG